ncbi:hypothetical protein AMECASPLE_029953, partial [Ameca splendens]
HSASLHHLCPVFGSNRGPLSLSLSFSLRCLWDVIHLESWIRTHPVILNVYSITHNSHELRSKIHAWLHMYHTSLTLICT